MICKLSEHSREDGDEVWEDEWWVEDIEVWGGVPSWGFFGLGMMMMCGSITVVVEVYLDGWKEGAGTRTVLRFLR